MFEIVFDIIGDAREPGPNFQFKVPQKELTRHFTVLTRTRNPKCNREKSHALETVFHPR